MGNEIISKELLSEVLNLNMWKTETLTISTEYNKLYYNGITLGDYGYYEYTEHINIHELAHKCKEWAKNKGYVIGVDLDKVNIWSIKEREVINHYEVYWEDYLEFEFRACQWILESKKD